MIRSNRYQIYLGNDTFYQIGKFFSRNNHNDSKKFILVDENTREHCLPLLQRSVMGFQEAAILEIPAGEGSKNIEVIVRLWDELTRLGADRQSLIVNLGGGVVIDAGGFAASTYMRGIHFINIPTTLLAMVDASVGGKNGINFGGLKNQVGTFSDPEAVFVSPVFLKTLPENEIRCGFAEVIKHALISDPNKWREVQAIGNFEDTNWADIIRESIWTKNKIVNSDYRDRHWRKSLNFGHTIGHALESYTLKNSSAPLKHGDAVAVGIIGETRLSHLLCGFPESDANAVYRFVKKHYPQPVEFDSEALLEIMKHDKKNQADKIQFALIKNIGEPVVNQVTDEDTIKQALEFCKEQLAEKVSSE